MASEVSELSSIKDEDLLRRMWQQTEDFCRKKEIRAHMYKLREERLRNFYTGDMDASIGMSKSPMMPSHGDSLADQSFQSLKAKEIRDCASPTRHIQYDMVAPDTSGWNVITTSQISSDGKEQSNTTLATTDAVKDIKGGKSTFSGKNELIESHKHDGDDKNYTTTSGHASNTVLKEHIVTGDANNGRTESSSNTTSSSSKIVTSSKYQSDNAINDDFVQEFEGVLNSARRSARDNTTKANNANNEQQFERIPCNDFEKEYFNSKTTNNSSTSNQQSSYEIRRNSATSTTSSIDAKKIQRETEYLANSPGQIISRSVEYPDANTKVITETKTLADGSTVTTTKYETRAASSTTTSKSSKQEKSSTSRTVTEDRAERNRIEIIAGNNKNVIDKVVKSKRIVDGDDKQRVKGDSGETAREKTVTKETYRNENIRKDDSRNDTYNQEFTRNATENQEKIQHEERVRREKDVHESSQDRSLKQQHEDRVRREMEVHEERVRREKDVHEERVRREKDVHESSQDRSLKQQNDNVTSRMEVIIDTNQRRDINKQNAQIQINTEDNYDKQSTEIHRTVKKDLSQSNEPYKKAPVLESDLPEERYDRQPVQEEIIVPKKQEYHVCSPSHDHSPKPVPKPDYTNKRISVDHNPTHDAFARSLRCVTPDIDKRSSTHSVKTNYTYTERDRRSPSRDTNMSDTSKFSSTTVTKSQTPNRKLSPEKRRPTISSETIDILTSDCQQVKNSKKIESTVRKNSQTNVTNRNSSRTEDHYDHPRNNQPVQHPKSTPSTLYDIPTNNSPVHNNDHPNRKHSSGQPSYSRPTASSARHTSKPKENDEPIYDTIGDRPSNDRRHPPSRTDSQTTYTTSVTRETKDYRNGAGKPVKKPSAAHKPDYEPNFDTERSNSPTSSVSDIEYVNFSNTNRKVVTDLDEIEIIINTKDKSIQQTDTNQDIQDGLFLSTHKKKASTPSVESDTDTIVEHDDDAKEPFYLIESHSEKTSKTNEVKETRRAKPPLTRSETYEERCRSMLGMKVESEEFSDETKVVKNSKQASVDFINSEQNVEQRPVSRSPTKSPERKNSTNSVADGSPSRSPERKSKISTKSTTFTEERNTTTDEDHRFDTFTRAKTNKSSSPKRTPLESNETVEESTSFDRKSSKIVNDHDRSNSTSPARKRKPSDFLPEVTKEFIKEESRSNSFTTTSSTKTKENRNAATFQSTREISPKREPKSNSNDTAPKRSTNRSPTTSPSRRSQPSKDLSPKQSPNRSPTTSPSRKSQPSRDLSPKQSPNRSPTTSPSRKSQPSRDISPKQSPNRSPTTSPSRKSQPSRDLSPKQSPIRSPNASPSRKSQPSRDLSPKQSPNRSPNASPSRKSQPSKDSIVETTKKLLTSESDVKHIVRKTSKSELRNSTTSRSTHENRDERDVKTVLNSKPQNKLTKEPLKSHTRVDRTSPTRTKTDETFVETSETFFSETKADTIKRRPVPESKSPTVKSNATSPDRKSTKAATVPKEPSRKSVTEESRAAPKRPLNVSVSMDNQDGNKITTNNFMRRKPSEPSEPLPSPTKPKGKFDSFSVTSSPVQSGKNTSPASKLKNKPAKVDVKSKPKSKPTNNYSTDDDSDGEVNTKKSTKRIPITERKDSAPVYRTTKVDKDIKMARSTSEHFSATTRKGSKPEIDTPKSPQKFDKRPTKCVTTKTINLSTTNTLNSEDMENVIIDIQLAKSSREPTPNRIIPTPVSPEEDTGKPRYPDTVHEPDDERPHRRPNIKNIPIFEEDTKEFISCHITEVCDDYDGTDSDECMLSVSDKVTKFSSKISSPSNDKFKRTAVESVNEFSEDFDDECKLSVQSKVSKFTAIAEEVNTTKTSRNSTTECNAKVNEKVAQFAANEVRNSKTSKPVKSEPVRNTDRVTSRRDFEDIDETLKCDECLLTVSEKVNKFVATAESLTESVPQISDVKSPELVAKIHRQVSLRDKPTKKDTDRQTPSDQHDAAFEKPTPRGKITDRYVPNKTKPTATATVPISLSSIDVVRKAKSIFEKEDSPKAPKQRDILSRPSIWEQKRTEAVTKADVKLTDIGVFTKADDSSSEVDSRQASRSPETRRSSHSPETIYRASRSPEPKRQSKPEQRYPSNEECVPENDHGIKKGSKLITEKSKPKPSKPAPKPSRSQPRYPVDEEFVDDDEDGARRSYMNHTIASLEHIRRDSIEINKTNIRKTTQDDEIDQVEHNPRSSVKFGVELKRTNSQQSAGGRRKSSCSEIPHVEEIFELELLERMLETVVGYEQRRRIRAQIRLVKKQLQDDEKLRNVKKTVNRTEVTTESFRRKQEPSPTRKSSPLRKKTEDVSECTSKYGKISKVDRTTSPVRKSSPQRRHIENDEFISSERTTITKEQQSVRRSSPNRKNFIDGNSNDQVNSYVQMSRSPSPKSNKISITANVRSSTDVKQVNNSKSTDDDKPIWARKNILTKASDSTRTFTSSGKKTTVTKVQKQKTVEQNDDCVTSSYGIGPTDEDGKPLFGIRALKKKSPAVQTSKVSGTIIQETLYSDNGAPATGSRTTTMYSSDPQDVRHFVETNGTASDIRNRLIERENSRRGITSVTTSQKIEANDATEDISTSSTKHPKIVRRGSVKELSEKFQKESSKSSEKTISTYPKAGLILRTQTSRESTPGANSSLRSGSADFDDCDIEVRCSSSRLQSDDEIEYKTSTSRQHQSRSFLNSNSKVTDVQDVLNRMRNADNVIEDGDTEEDKEARALLNKFLGASVLMSGMESMVPREITTIVGKPSSQKQITTTHVTKTIKSTSSPSTTREIKTRDIDSIWDEELLKHLLDQSANYEERRKIRARLRQVMAEKEACADIVASVTAELKQQKLEKETSKKMEVKQTTKKEESEEEDDDDEYEYEEVEVTDEEEEESEHETKVVVTKSNDSKKATTTTTTTTAAATAATVTKSTVKVEEKKESSQESNIQVKSDEASKTVTTTQSITNARTVSTTKAVPAKPISPFAKFRQLDKQVSTQSSPNSPNSPSTPKSPGGAPLFKFTDPVLSARAATVKDILLQWCQSKTKEYENVQITNFSTAWSDGLAFCALCHHFLPDSFDYSVLTPKQRRHNFTLAFRIMDEKAGIAPLLDVEDMVIMKKPDWKCVFTYVQSIHRRFRNVD